MRAHARDGVDTTTTTIMRPSQRFLRIWPPSSFGDVKRWCLSTMVVFVVGYLQVFTQTLLEELDQLPGDARTQVGFLCYDSSLYFFNLSDSLLQPQMMVVPDIDGWCLFLEHVSVCIIYNPVFAFSEFGWYLQTDCTAIQCLQGVS